MHIHLIAALLVAQGNDVAEVILGNKNGGRNDRFADFLDLAEVGQLGRILDLDHRTVTHHHLIHHGRRGGNEVLVKFPLQTLLNDFHVQQAEEAAAEAETQGLGNFRLVLEGGIIELELFQGLAQGIVLVGLDRIQARENLRLDFLEARQGFAGLAVHLGNGVADLGGSQLLDAGNDKTDLTGPQHITLHRLGRKDTNLLAQLHRTGGHEKYFFLGTQFAINNAHQHDHADIIIEPGIDDQCLERRRRIPLGRRHAGNHRLENIFHTETGLGRGQHRLGGVDTDHVLDFLTGIVRIGRRQVDLVKHRHDFHIEIKSGIAIGHGLGFNPLGSIDHQERTFASGQGTGNFVGEVHMSRRIDQVQVIDLPVPRLVAQGRRLGLDGDTPLALDIHRVENLGFHLAVGQAAAQVNDAISQGRLPVVDVGNDGEVSYMFHAL